MTKAGDMNGVHRKLSVACLLFGAGLLSVSFINPSSWLTQGFETAFDQQAPSASRQLASAKRTWRQPVAGTEDYWLGSAKNSSKHPDLMKASLWRPAIAPGDKFKFGAGDGGVREFVVVNVAPISEATAAPGGAFLITSHALHTNKFEVLKLVVDAKTPWPSKIKADRRAQAL